MEDRVFKGYFITDKDFYNVQPRKVFGRQLDHPELAKDERENSHILFRKKFICDRCGLAKIYITADDYYKLYVNGKFVGQGPAPCYVQSYGYNVFDVTEYLREGENVLAVHTYYQGLINRVWVSGDYRHGLILDLEADGKTVACSDESFLTHKHTAYSSNGIIGYETQFLENYDSRATEVGFEEPDFDDSEWENAKRALFADYTLETQKTHALVFERIDPVKQERKGNKFFLDFGKGYVGYLNATAKGKNGEVVTVRCAQELNDDGSIRYNVRARCLYEEKWTLSGDRDALNQFDYKSFRYAELELPDGCTVEDIYLTARHYPFELKTGLKPEYADNEKIRSIWGLVIHSQKYGVQEVIQDCMEREKGFYLGDGCYTALTHMVLTGDDSMARKLIDDAFKTTFISDTLATCMDCSFVQEIAEFPLILVDFVLWHYNYTGDKEYLAQNYPKVTALLDAYKRDYETDGLLSNMDKWCVAEWPSFYRNGYAIELSQTEICKEAHVVLNAYYVKAIKSANIMAQRLGKTPYREEKELIYSFMRAFYDPEKHLFYDGVEHRNVSFVGNIFPFGFDICNDGEYVNNVLAWLDEKGISSVSMFCTFIMLEALTRIGDKARIKQTFLNEEAWLNMLKEGATTTFEVWAKNNKLNCSLFHLTNTDAALFLADVDLKKIFF